MRIDNIFLGTTDLSELLLSFRLHRQDVEGVQLHDRHVSRLRPVTVVHDKHVD